MSTLDELFAQPPSVENFRAILERLDQLDGPERDTAIARAEAALAAWPDESRCAGEEILSEELAPGALFKPTAVLVRKLAFAPSHGGCEPWLVVELARAPELSRLAILDLAAEDVEDDGAAAIAGSAVLQGLKTLRLGQRIGDDGFLAIARSPHLARLERLELEGTIADDDTARALAGSPNLARLTRLDLEFDMDDEEMIDESLRILGRSPHIPAAVRRALTSSLDDDEEDPE